MSGRFRRRGFSSRMRYSRSRYSGRRFNSSARRARGNIRAANQQTDTSNVNINLMKKIKTGVTGYKEGNGDNEKIYDIGTAAVNIFDLLKKSEFYQSYSNMYDQFRVNRIQVKLTPVTWRTHDQYDLPENEDDDDYMNGDEGSLNPKKYIVPQALTIVTAWDRTGLDKPQLISKDGGITMINIGDKITTYSSAKSTQLIAGANFNCVRYLYPSSQQEKSLYFSTSDLVDQYDKVGEKWYEIPRMGSVTLDSKYITNLESDPNCPFKPTFLVGVLKVDDLDYGTTCELTKKQIYPVTFNLEFDIGVTFRGLRKTQVV